MWYHRIFSSILLLLYICSFSQTYSQVSIVSGSTSNSKTGYTPGQGENRLIVVSVSDENPGSIGTISSITWGAQNLTLAIGRTNPGSGGDDNRVEIWYLTEDEIISECTPPNDFVVTWTAGPLREIFTVVTLQGVDQIAPISATEEGATPGSAQEIDLSAPMSVYANDLSFYASISDRNSSPSTNHVPPVDYTELSEQFDGDSHLATAYKQITSAGSEQPEAAWNQSARLVIVGVVFNGNINSRTYYSRNATSGGDWDDNTSWTTISDGSGGPLAAGIWPRRSDNVVILNGHTITIDAVTDNNPCSQSPNGLGRANVGNGGDPFTGAGDQMFYHKGDILVSNGGLLSASEEVMLEGYTQVKNGGTFTMTEDIVNLGYLEVSSTATFSTTDDLILTGNSITVINNTTTSSDDLYLEWTDATLCGGGDLEIGGGANPTVQYFNTATSAQICSSFPITCTDTTPPCVPFAAPSGSFSVGITGPGGVATTDGTSELILWLDAGKDVYSDAGTTPAVDGGIVQQWNDQSGYGNNATQTGNEPTFDEVQATLNGAPAITFTAGSSNLFNLNSITLDPTTSSFSIISVLNVNSSGSNQVVVQQKDLSGTGRAVAIFTNSPSRLISFLGGVATTPAASYTFGTWSVFTNTYNDIGATTDINLYKDGTGDGFRNVTPESSVGAWLIGSNKIESAAFLNGQMPEIIIMSQSLNSAKRIIIDNYLSAKYNITLTANDVYTMDNVGNGDYDFEVAGIGQAADGSNHRDAQGTGIVRMWNPSDLDNSEFLMWGHDNTDLSTTDFVDVDGIVIQERLSRIWRTGESGDVGTVSISFDFSVVGSPLGSNLRLLLDRDNDFTTNDVPPIIGSVTGGIAVFSNVNFIDGDRFTLGNIDATWSLPIELISFDAEPNGTSIFLSWSTASELNNDYFTIERSKSAQNWEVVTTVDGLGTTEIKNEYFTIDDRPYSGISYYRLKQTDFDGTFTYSGIVSVQLEKEDDLKIYPNPSRDSFRIKTGFELNDANIIIHDLAGRMIPSTIRKEQYTAEVQLNDAPAGIYILEVNDGLKIYKQKILLDH